MGCVSVVWLILDRLVRMSIQSLQQPSLAKLAVDRLPDSDAGQETLLQLGDGSAVN